MDCGSAGKKEEEMQERLKGPFKSPVKKLPELTVEQRLLLIEARLAQLESGFLEEEEEEAEEVEIPPQEEEDLEATQEWNGTEKMEQEEKKVQPALKRSGAIGLLKRLKKT